MRSSNLRGVLSQTLASSPVIRTVLPARVRSPLLNDVVFVGHSSIHLREFTQNGYLSNVIADLEIGTQILSAKVVSAEEHILSTEDAILENGRDETRYKIRGEPCPDDQPAQIVVLSLTTGDLVFVYARTSANGQVHFIHARRQILPTKSLQKKYGRLLAVDSESRALAVASTKGAFGIFALKHVDEIKSSIEAWDPRVPEDTLPFREQRFVPIDGTILHMDFLRSPTADPNRVVLLLIVTNAGATRLLLYTWNSRSHLSSLKPLRCSGQPLPAADSNPQLLIPSCRWTSFAIVTGPKIVFYDDVNSRSMKRSSADIGDGIVSDKRWVQFAKPFRHVEHMKKKEDIFLVREDGHIGNVVVTHNSDSRFSIHFSPGQLGITVDTAICALSPPPTMGGDILIACGHTTGGGVFHLAALKRPSELQKLSNWSPINEVVTKRRRSETMIGSSTILASTGSHKDNSYFSELRHGIEAHIILTAQDGEADTMDRIWCLYRPRSNDVLLLASHHEHTSAICYNPSIEEFSMEDIQSLPGLIIDQPTLAVSTIWNHYNTGIILQITKQAVVLGNPVDSGMILRSDWTGNFLIAAITQSGERTSFAVVENEDNKLQLISGLATRLTNGRYETLQGQKIALDYVPVDLQLFILHGTMFCVSLSQEDQIVIHDHSNNAGFAHHRQWNLSDLEMQVKDTFFSSLALLQTDDNILLACGTKTGSLILLELSSDITLDGPDISLEMVQIYSLGDTRVKLVTDSMTSNKNEATAFATCGETGVQIRLHENKCGLDYTVSSLILTDQHQPSYKPSDIRAINRLGMFQSGFESHFANDLIICAVKDEILLLNPGHTTTIVRPVQQIPASSHLAYDRHLEACVIGVNSASTPAKGYIPSPSDVPYLQMVDNDSDHGRDKTVNKAVIVGEPGEILTRICPWQPTDEISTDGLHHNLIVFSTQLGNVSKLSYVSSEALKGDGNDPHPITEYPGLIIHTFCIFRLSSLVLCVNKTLRMVTLDMESDDWSWNQSDFELPSPAIEMEAQGHVLYVATASHSFMLVREEDGQFRQVGSDKWAGEARSIMPYGRHSTLVNLISKDGGRLLSFPERPKQGIKPTFEARIPQAINRIVWLKPADTSARDRLLGTTANGTIYLFTVLTEPEMKLLDFLQNLCEPVKDQSAKALGALAQRIATNLAHRLEEEGVVPPDHGTTHARGDLLARMLLPGPYNLWSLLKNREHLQEADIMVKQEDEIELLTSMARSVVGGDGNDVIERVLLWLRKLLHVSYL